MKVNFLAIIALALTLTACAGNKNAEEELVNTNQSAQQMYEEAKNVLDSGLYNRAIELLKSHGKPLSIWPTVPSGAVGSDLRLLPKWRYHSVFSQYRPFYPLKPKPSGFRLRLLHAWFRAILKLTKMPFRSFVGIDRADRDMSSTKQGFEDFKILVSTYPNSKYANDARKRMFAIKEKLVRYELLVADYYVRRGAHLAAANRCKYIVEILPRFTTGRASTEDYGRQLR